MIILHQWLLWKTPMARERNFTSKRTTGKLSLGSLCPVIIFVLSITGGLVCLTPHLKCHWAQPLRLALFGNMLLMRIQPDAPTRPLVVNMSCGLLWKFGENSAASGATQREVLRCRASDSLREGKGSDHRHKPTARRETTPGSLTSEPPLENTISVLQQLTWSWSLRSQRMCGLTQEMEPPPQRSGTKEPEPSTLINKHKTSRFYAKFLFSPVV